MDKYLLLGRVIDSFSLDGTLKIVSSSSFGAKRFKTNSTIYLVKNEERIECHVISARESLGLLFIKVEEINSKEDALAKKGYIVEVTKDDSLLKKGEYYYCDLEACDVFDQNDNHLGKVKKIEEYSSQLSLRILLANNKEILVPYVKAFIKNIDINAHKININVIEGMI